MNEERKEPTMQITIPHYYKDFSCIAGDCPDTCCAGWQIMIDDKALEKYRHVKGTFRNRLHNGIDWKNQTFRQYNRRCEFLNEENLCDIYSEAGQHMLCDTCRKYPRHIEEFEGSREISLSLSCPEAAKIILGIKDKVTFITKEKETNEETYEDFDYFLFTALMDTRDEFIAIIQDREVPMKLRLLKLLACGHDFQLSLDKNELYIWDEIRKRHLETGYGDNFTEKVNNRRNPEDNSLSLMAKMWKTIIPEMEVLRPGWHDFLGENLFPLYVNGQSAYDAHLDDFYAKNSDWEIQMEQLLVYWIFTYFCGAVYDDEIFAKIKMAVVCTLFIRDLAVGSLLKNEENLSFTDLTSICYRFSRELEHSDLNLNRLEELLAEEDIFSFESLLRICK